MVASVARFPAVNVYQLKVDLGESGTETDRATVKKAADRYVALLPPGSFSIGVNNIYLSLFDLQVAQLRGDHGAVLRGTAALNVDTETLKASSEGQKSFKHQILRDIADTDAESAYATGDLRTQPPTARPRSRTRSRWIPARSATCDCWISSVPGSVSH